MYYGELKATITRNPLPALGQVTFKERNIS